MRLAALPAPLVSPLAVTVAPADGRVFGQDRVRDYR